MASLGLIKQANEVLGMKAWGSGLSVAAAWLAVQSVLSPT